MHNIQISLSIIHICNMCITIYIHLFTSELLNFGTADIMDYVSFFWGSREICPGFCMMFISIHGPYPPDVSSTSQLRQPKLLQTSANISWAGRCWANDLIENHWSVYTHTHTQEMVVPERIFSKTSTSGYLWVVGTVITYFLLCKWIFVYNHYTWRG